MKMSSKWITSAAIGIGSFALALGSVGVAQAHNSEGGSGTGGGKRGGPQSALIADGTITQAQAGTHLRPPHSCVHTNQRGLCRADGGGADEWPGGGAGEG